MRIGNIFSNCHRIELILIITVLVLSSFCFNSGSSFAHENKIVHPYIVEEAFKIWPQPGTEANNEMWVYLGGTHTEPADGYEGCLYSQSGASIKEGSIEEDLYDPMSGLCNGDDYLIGYYHHFYNCDLPEPYNGLFGAPNYGALKYAQMYWNEAKNYYRQGDKGRAYWYLGRVAHLLADASVPAHVKLDAHPIWDTYEKYMATGDNRYKWKGYKLTLDDIPESWSLEWLFYNLGQRAQFFPSDNDFSINTVNLNVDSSKWPTFWPPMTNKKAEKIANYMMPLSFQYTAALFRLFWKETHPDYSSPYTFTTLNYPDAISTNVMAIEGNRIAGYYYSYDQSLGQYVTHGFIYDGTSWTRFDYPGAYQTYINTINNGVIVGSYVSFDGKTHGFSFDGKIWKQIDYPGADNTYASGNDGRKITGYYSKDYMNHGFVYDGKAFKQIDYNGSIMTVVMGITAKFLWGSYNDGLKTSGFIYDGNWQIVDYPDACTTFLFSVENTFMAGYYSDCINNGNYHGFVYDGNSWKSIDYPGSPSTVVFGSNAGVIVGSYLSADRSYWNGFIGYPK